MTTARGVAALIAERPALESTIETILRADEPFAFDDLAADSGTFGELVAAELVGSCSHGAPSNSTRGTSAGPSTTTTISKSLRRCPMARCSAVS
jgi:hypothetical protein